MHAPGAGRLDIGQGLVHPGLKVLKTVGQGGQAALAGIPVSRRHVEQGEGQSAPMQVIGDHRGGMIIGKQKLNRGKARVGRSGEPVQEGPFVEHHGQIGGEHGHGQ